MDLSMDIVLLIIMVPTLLIMFFYEYPSKWSERKFIFGVRNREEFKEEKAVLEIDKIVSKTRKQAIGFMICSFALMGLIMLIPDEMIRMTVWVFFIIADLFIFSIPFMRSNREMKTLKRELGIGSSGTTYADLKSVGTVHALKLTSIIIPNALTAIIFICALIFDLGVTGLSPAPEMTYALTAMTGSFLFTGLMLIPISIMMDHIRNEVISSDSDTNIAYNRAKKKVYADMFVLMSWINTGVVILYAILLFFVNNDMVLIIQMTAYLLLLMAALVILVKKSLAIDKRYRKETNIDVDDDDKWIFGAFYYNPDDRRLNVAKRMGIGGTINMAHPAGKIITIAFAVFIIATLAFMGFVVSLGKSTMKADIVDDTLVCNLVVDHYKIPLSDINDPELCEMKKGFYLSRQVGIGMEPYFIGKFIVNGEPGCEIFLNTETDYYVRFVVKGKTYCISGNSDEETKALFEALKTN